MSRADNATGQPPSGIAVAIRYVEGFLSDYTTAVRQARSAADEAGASRIMDLWVEYFDGMLHNLDGQGLIEYLESRRVWRSYSDWPIYKTADVPCLAFTASVDDRGGNVILIALGLCYRYPADSAETWWQEVILPRIRIL